VLAEGRDCVREHPRQFQPRLPDAVGSGGAIYNTGTLTLEATTLSHDHAGAGAGGQGAEPVSGNNAAASGASIAVHVQVGTTVSYSDSEAAKTTFVVSGVLSGVKVGGRCVAPPRHGHAHDRKCTRLKRIGAFTHADVAGRNRFEFTGRVSGRRLRPGRYQLAGTPRADGLTGKTAVQGFRVVR